MYIVEIVDDLYHMIKMAIRRRKRNKIVTKVPEFWRQNMDYDGVNFIDKLRVDDYDPLNEDDEDQDADDEIDK